MKQLTVRAADGLHVPLEDNPRRHIGTEPVTVPDRAYYRRLLRAGDLLDATATPTETVTTATPTEAKKKREARK
ncbi:DUF2635 domain-containing protein [Salmonella enterica]|nr:DUF2635 domain-containing protein [Salmonella enterica subsp. enterica serovar Sandiego]EIE7704874.1 DUF2635 domain-containing protein [Salmonella enterica]EIN2107193.1 DUF2635 domain-containing protein [Salmonella enterica]EIO8763635.1 DUF2635 domain-containing protein [Salmonella enterica]